MEYHTKVFAYITHRRKLLVFKEREFPEGGIQVPAGSLKKGEKPEEAVIREAREETGLQKLYLAEYLGETIFDNSVHGKEEIHCRKFYHLIYEDDPPDQWSHEEKDPSVRTSDTPDRIIFDLFWIDLDESIPDLQAGHDTFLVDLLDKLKIH